MRLIVRNLRKIWEFLRIFEEISKKIWDFNCLKNWKISYKNLRNFWENFDKFLRKKKSLCLMLCCWTESVFERQTRQSAFERQTRQRAKQNELSLSCLQLAPSPVEAVKTQRVSAQSVCVSTESACSHQAHQIWCTFTLPHVRRMVSTSTCLSKKEEAWDPLSAAKDQVPRDLVLKPL